MIKCFTKIRIKIDHKVYHRYELWLPWFNKQSTSPHWQLWLAKLGHFRCAGLRLPTLNMLSAEGFEGNCWLEWRGRYIYQSHPAIGNTRVHSCSVQEHSRKLHRDERGRCDRKANRVFKLISHSRWTKFNVCRIHSRHCLRIKLFIKWVCVHVLKQALRFCILWSYTCWHWCIHAFTNGRGWGVCQRKYNCHCLLVMVYENIWSTCKCTLYIMKKYSLVCPILPNVKYLFGPRPYSNAHMICMVCVESLQASALQSSRPQRNPAASAKSATSVTIERDTNRFCF